MPPVLSKEQLSAEDLKVLRHLYWTLQNEDEKKWKCNQCPITRVKGNGWTNLETHVFEKHTDYKEKLADSQRSNSKGISFFFNAASEDAKNFHDCIEWMVMKIQTNKEDKLTPAEKRAVKVFLLAPSADEEAGEEAEEDFTEMIARLEEEAMAPKTKSKYRSLSHISPTSVVVERLFSRAKLIMIPHQTEEGKPDLTADHRIVTIYTPITILLLNFHLFHLYLFK